MLMRFAAWLALLSACLTGTAQGQLIERSPAEEARPRAAAPAPRASGEVRAQLTPRQYTTLAAEIGARVSRVPVAEGESFRQGEVLIEFDCLIPAAQLSRAQAMLSGSERTLQANLRLKEYNSVGQLELDVSRAENDKNRAEVAQMEATMSKCKVPAPFPGRVAEQKVREQQFVQPGQGLLDILDDSALELEFIVPSRWLQWLRPGYAFSVRIDETARNYPARVQRLGARVDPVSQSIKVTAAIQGRFPELLAGMSGRASLGPAAGQ
jgi:RND family efflux transporter MFP subunit